MAENKQSKYSMRYDSKNTKTYSLKVNKNTEIELYEYLESVENVNGYIKDLIKANMGKKK